MPLDDGEIINTLETIKFVVVRITRVQDVEEVAKLSFKLFKLFVNQEQGSSKFCEFSIANKNTKVTMPVKHTYSDEGFIQCNTTSLRQMHPRLLVTFDENMKEFGVIVRIFDDTIGDCTYRIVSTPVILRRGERAELHNTKYFTDSPRLEGFVVLYKNHEEWN